MRGAELNEMLTVGVVPGVGAAVTNRRQDAQAGRKQPAMAWVSIKTFADVNCLSAEADASPEPTTGSTAGSQETPSRVLRYRASGAA